MTAPDESIRKHPNQMLGYVHYSGREKASGRRSESTNPKACEKCLGSEVTLHETDRQSVTEKAG